MSHRKSGPSKTQQNKNLALFETVTGKGDSLERGNYRGLNLKNQTLKIADIT